MTCESIITTSNSFFNVARLNFVKRKSRSPRGVLPRPLLRAGESLAPPPQPQKNSGGAHHSFFSKKVRANDTITSQTETSEEVSAKSGRAEGALYGESRNSAFWARANSVGGQNETETDLSRNCEFVPIFLK